jgi:putative OPT family oligopeptide transporter
VLELLNHANGFAGAPNVNAISDQPLAAPQATLISTLAKGVIGGDLKWDLIGYGALIGLALVALDYILKKSSDKKYSCAPLGVGLAIYLPSAVTSPVVVGAIGGYLFERAMRGKPLPASACWSCPASSSAKACSTWPWPA